MLRIESVFKVQAKGRTKNLPKCQSSCSTVLSPRLLSQLDETERAFDEFWVRHQTKLEQCLQLRHFEHNYREVSWIQVLTAHRFLAYMHEHSDRRLPAAGEDTTGSGGRETHKLFRGGDQPSPR